LRFSVPEKCILIIMDGLGDRSHEQLMHQTPLQAARTPVLDNLSERGANGMYHASMLGQALSSENAHFAIFGYDREEFPGRGALEALGSGIELGPRDVAVLAHLVSLTEKDGHLILERNKPVASVREIDEIVGAIGSYEKKGVEVRYFPTGGINGIVILKGDVSPYITDSDPMREGSCLSDIKPWYDSINNRAARITAEVLRSYLLWIYHQLEKHPVNLSRKKEGILPLNGLVTQRAGQLRTVSPLHERYGIRGISIASGIVYHGLGGYLGLDVRKVTDTGDPGRDIAERLRLAH
jgi:2,3-bisphosphoglycerate-independent phosphoglycerate mutase